MVKELLNTKQKTMIFCNKVPKHIYVFCRSSSIATHFLKDAQAEGFSLPTEKEIDSIFEINPDFTVSKIGWAGHILFHNGRNVKEVVRVDYGKYLSGSKNYLM